MPFAVESFDVAKFDAVLARGLSHGVGQRDGQMCIEAAICTVLDLPHGDDPGCVANAVRSFKIALNDAAWSSPEARAKGLRDLGLAQLGSLGVVSDQAFLNRLGEKLIRRLVPHVLRRAPAGMDFTKEADRCEAEGTADAAAEAARARAAAWAAWAVEAAWVSARAAEAAEAAWVSARAADRPALDPDFYLVMAAQLALETLRELNSPGVTLLDTK